MPQVEDLVARADKYIKFEIELAQLPMKAMFGGGGTTTNTTVESEGSSTAGEGEYEDATWEDIDAFAKFLGGGV